MPYASAARFLWAKLYPHIFLRWSRQAFMCSFPPCRLHISFLRRKGKPAHPRTVNRRRITAGIRYVLRAATQWQAYLR